MIIDCKKHYSDEFYEKYIKDFKPNIKKKLFYRFVKRTFDIVCSLIAIVLLSPIMLITAILVKTTSKGPIIFKQQRMGRNCKTFNCYKFRSMKIDSPHDMATSLIDNPDEFYTPIGKFIRKLSLDEFPQFFNIFAYKIGISVFLLANFHLFCLLSFFFRIIFPKSLDKIPKWNYNLNNSNLE